MTCERSVPAVSRVIADFLRRKDLDDENAPWALGESPLGGIGIFATRDIACGEEIFRDYPVIDGPRIKHSNSLFCVACYKQTNLAPCPKRCGLPICSKICTQHHQSECHQIKTKRSEVQEIDVELFKNLTPLRCLSLREDDKAVVAILKHHKGSNHGIEVDKLKSIGFKFEEQEEDYIRRVCCVMDANAFEVMIENEGKESDFRGLYPLASLVNHSCVPNLTHAFDQNKVMVVKACVPIREGQELFHSYVRLIWSTPTRQFNLVKTKHFICKCPRCLDPTEFGTYMSGILCKKCKGNVIPINPLNTKSNWRCEDCGTEVSVPEMAKIICVLGSVLRTFDDEDLELMLKFLKMKLSDLVHSNHEIAVDLKYRMVWIIGHHEKYRLKDIDDNLLDFKTNICKDLLKLLESLKLGDNKMKGLLSIEMLSCLKEKHRRKTSSKMNGHDKVISGQAEKYFEGTCSILKEAVSSDVKI
ncbi:SET domain-containing protein SmydA-8-like [Harmonia axyridis]|uniref:SET domain-containing protein SmydA-8-like n=1 Tax=Harmonia axyridis TaxID=115357 RepID=UPI001E2751AB|nr:SET domain-containing protein SmydA-8-like [Harmonia axyridis]XP_045470201.1 SET domain-containing protein SmydA-8-like [Harmonia axyridis]XP_045470202.1 SET domain-containing protein SmydA-8-like [Harmonia axyridis]